MVWGRNGEMEKLDAKMKHLWYTEINCHKWYVRTKERRCGERERIRKWKFGE